VHVFASWQHSALYALAMMFVFTATAHFKASAFWNCPATNSGSVSSNFCDSQPCSTDFCSSDMDTKRTPKWPVFDQQIVDSARRGAV